MDLDGTHSEIRFKIKHLMISNVSGNFNKFDAEVKTKSDDFITASITAKIDVASINTNNEQRDAHLRTADFLSQKTSTNHIYFNQYRKGG